MSTLAGVVPPTRRGRAARDRIVAAAATLMYERGVAGTSLDDVRVATATSKSQLYHYFADKSDLVCAVLDHQWRAVLAGQQPHLGQFATLAELRAWRDRLVTLNSAVAVFGGCPIGGLASEVSASDDRARATAVLAFVAWQAELCAGLQRMRDAGELPEDCEPDELALGLLAAIQGGLLLSQTLQQVKPLETALDHAIARIAALVPAARQPEAEPRPERGSGRGRRGRSAGGDARGAGG